MVALLIAAPAEARSCAGLVVRTTAASRAADATLIRQQARQPDSARNIGAVLNDGRWRLIWATPDAAERGVYFFRQTGKRGWRYADVWGGVIAPGEEADVAKWARGLTSGGPDARTVRCFIDTVKAGT
jgi:hypothetical protein